MTAPEKTYPVPGGTARYSVRQMDLWCYRHVGMDHMQLTRWLHPDLPASGREYDLLRRRVGTMILMLMDSDQERPAAAAALS